MGVMNKINSASFSSPLLASGAFSLIGDDLLPDIFAAGLALGPDRVAIVFGKDRLTYGELDARAAKVASALKARGVGRGAFVGLCMTRSADLHVGLLGILKAGAAYIPFDADAPADRIAECLADCGAGFLVADAVTAARVKAGVALPILDVPALVAEPERPGGPAPEGATPDDIAYVIYTSGSTGKPKGVMTTHRNICHFLRSANTVYGIEAADVVFQGCSVAFDLSLEEIFIPYMVGASLWVASRAQLDDTEGLPALLGAANVTVIDTVPTLLAMMGEDVPSLRVIILGGETLPPTLAERWCRAGRRLFNSYGPTEATVVATVAEVLPGEPVTIGRPIPNYSCYVVDEAMGLVEPGLDGELLIGGPGVAKGYLHRPELTAEKFIVNPFPGNGLDPRLYRSGDRVCWDGQGRLVFKGRIDDQVKIRGFRVELGEIESRLAKLPGVAQAAVVLRTEDGADRLVAFIVPAPGAEADRALLRQSLRGQLPCYMIPSHFEAVAVLPRLISGKVDRKALALVPLEAVEAELQEEPANATEAVLLAAAKRVFPGMAIPFDADIFLDLGGHSLIAARFVSAVRETPSLAGLTLQDVYKSRTLRAMAAKLSSDEAEHGIQVASDLSFEPPSLARRFLCGLAQAAIMPLILALITAPWLGVFVAYQLFSGEEHNFWNETAALLVTYGIINFATIAVAIVGKWLAIGRTKPGRYPLWGAYYYRWWLSQRFSSMVHLKWFQGTPIMRLFLRALGAHIGDEAIIGDVEAGAVDLISIGRGASIGGKTMLANAQVIGNELIIGPIAIGADAYTGTGCIIGHDTFIGEGVELADLTAIPAGSTIGAWEAWQGSPAQLVGAVDRAALPPRAEASALRQGTMAVIYGLMLLLLPPITLMPIIPAFYLFDSLSDTIAALGLNEFVVLPILSWPTAMALIAVTVLMIALVRWVVLPRVRAGTYSVHSGFYLRKWIVALATELTLETLSSLYATVYMRNWYRLMGAKIGKDAEISTNLAGRYDLVEIGEKCFIADEVVLGDEDIRGGWMFLKKVKTGPRVFVGNDAVVPPGAVLPEGTLIGIKSRPPTGQAVEAGDIWFGSPPIKLPVRQRFDDVNKNWTFEPSNWRRVGRAIFEAFSVSLPTMLFITFGTIAVDILAPAILAKDYARLLPVFVASSVAISCALVASAIAVKWLLMGAYKPMTRPMWSWWALRTEAVAVMYWGMAGKVLLDHLRGTPMLPWVLRLFGCKFGQGVFMDTTDITEFDCIDVGDFCAINTVAALQTHLYEDRVMKVGRVRLGKGVSIGTGSTVLYDTYVGDFAQVGDLTIIMKGEDIPPHTRWRGAPAEGIAAARSEPANATTKPHELGWQPASRVPAITG